LTYQLYAQSLVWPLDPFYENVSTNDSGRRNFMAGVQNWAAAIGHEQTKMGAPFGGYRGPGILSGFADNLLHDPILYSYKSLDPKRPSISFGTDRWTEIHTPSAIADNLGDVYMSYRRTGSDLGATVIERVRRGPSSADVILAFEGGTGDKGEDGQPHSHSLMGFVLLRRMPATGTYDIHVAFRGSRSGSAARAALEAFSEDNAKGNPDWITDLGYDLVSAEAGGGHISSQGKVHRGLARSVASIEPQLFRCLSKVNELMNGALPRNIYVTGHSLGGGLAQHFVSSVLLGDAYGPAGQGDEMPNALKIWPWQNTKLVTFSAPVSGDETWAKILTTDTLKSTFFDKAAFGTILTDPAALAVDNPHIVPRLTDPDEPAAYRILNSVDPITTLRVVDGKHVGQTVYVDQASRFGIVDPNTHEPSEVRALMTERLADDRTPASGWAYRTMSEMDPNGNPSDDGGQIQIDRLAQVILSYEGYESSTFDREGFLQNYGIFKSFLANPI
jgi:hypothetical protein